MCDDSAEFRAPDGTSPPRFRACRASFQGWCPVAAGVWEVRFVGRGIEHPRPLRTQSWASGCVSSSVLGDRSKLEMNQCPSARQTSRSKAGGSWTQSSCLDWEWLRTCSALGCRCQLQTRGRDGQHTAQPRTACASGGPLQPETSTGPVAGSGF